MKLLIVGFGALVAFGAVVHARVFSVGQDLETTDDKWIIIPDMQNRLHFVNTRQPTPRAVVADNEVTFYYFSRGLKQYVLQIDNIDEIVFTDFSPKRKTMFIIHGWTSNGKSEMNDLITAALLKVDEWNVFNIDWSGPASKNYLSAKASLSGVASIIARFINHLKEHYGLPLDNVHIAGHSLGGQMAGRLGAILNGQAASIVGLDPAMPLFSYIDLSDRLDPTDAKIVQVIHTNGGFLGFFKPIGHSDFYPNGGRTQNGCGKDLFGLCAHCRAYEYFTESILSGKFEAHACDSFDKYLTGVCYSNHFAFMGGNVLDISANGSYYLETESAAPFAKA